MLLLLKVEVATILYTVCIFCLMVCLYLIQLNVFESGVDI